MYIDIATGAVLDLAAVAARFAATYPQPVGPGDPMPPTMINAAALGLAPILPGTPPAVPRHHDLVRGDPAVQGDGTWCWTWTAVPWAPDRVAADLDKMWSRARERRSALLLASDWTDLPSAPLSSEVRAAWRAYRQDLRDITDQPDPYDLAWPTPPET